MNFINGCVMFFVLSGTEHLVVNNIFIIIFGEISRRTFQSFVTSRDGSDIVQERKLSDLRCAVCGEATLR